MKKILNLGIIILILYAFSFAPIVSADRTFSLPPQAGQSGNFLQTNGTNPLWASVSGSNNPFNYPGVTSTTITNANSPYTVLSTDQIIIANTTSGNIEIDLPAASTNVYRNIIVYKPSYANSISIYGAGSDNINQLPVYTFTQGQSGVHLEAITTSEWIATNVAGASDVAPVIVNVTQTGTILPNAPTYSNGTAGVGATLTANANVALGAIDGVTLTVGQTVLIRSQASQLTNGVYSLTQQGTGSVPWILTRWPGQDNPTSLNPQIVIASSGTTERGILFAQITPQTIVIGTTSLVYSQTSVSGNFVTQATGTQYNTGIPTWNGVVRQLSIASSNFAFNSTGNILTLGSDGILQFGQLNMNGQSMIQTGPVANGNMTLGYFSPAITAGQNQLFIAPCSSQNTNVSGSQNATLIGGCAGIGLNGGTNNTFIGYIAGDTDQTGSSDTIIGSGADVGSVTSAGDTVIGGSANAGAFSNSIILGRSSSGTASNQFIAGSTTANTTNVYFGNGVKQTGTTNGTSYTINGSGAAGINKNGGNVTITGGIGTGTGTAGQVIISATQATSTGSTNANAAVPVITVNGGTTQGTAVLPYATIVHGDNSTFNNISDTSKVLGMNLSGMTTGVTTTITNAATTSQNIALPVTRETETFAVRPQIFTTLSTPLNPTGTTTTAPGVMMGMGTTATITPQVTGNVLVNINGNLTTSVGGDGARVKIYMGTGTAPANGAAPSGTSYGGQQIFNAVTGTLSVPFSQTVLVTGLTVGTAYWIDTNVQAITGGTASITGVAISANEL